MVFSFLIEILPRVPIPPWETDELLIPLFNFCFSLVLADKVTKIPQYYVICLFTFFKSLVRLALQMETIVKKITQP